MPATAASVIGLKIVAQDETGKAITSTTKAITGLKRSVQQSGTTQLAKQLGIVSSSASDAGDRLGNLVTQGLVRMPSALTSAAVSAGKLAVGLTAIGALTSVAGAIGFAKQFAEMGAEAGRTAARLGIPVSALSRFSVAARLAGDSSEEATSGLVGLQQTMNAAAHGQNNEAFTLFKSLGIDITQGAKDVTTALPRIAEITKQLAKNNPAAALRFLEKTGVGGGLFEVFKGGAAGLQSWNDQADRMGHLSEEDAAKSRALELAATGLGISFETTARTIGGTFAPALTVLMGKFQTFLVDHKDDVTAFFGEVEQGLEWIIKPENQTAIGRYFDTFTGGLKTAFGWAEKLESNRVLRALLGISDVVSNLPGLGTLLPGMDLGARAAAWLHGDHPPGGGHGDTAGAVGGPTLFPGAGTQGAGNERNIRNNNPGNLMFAGQPGATSDGRFARFPNMESGVAADLNQYLIYQDRDHLRTIEAMVLKATPRSENPGVDRYIDDVARRLGVGRNIPIDLHNPQVAARYITAIAANEGGTPGADAVRRGVELRLGVGTGTSAQPPPVTPPPGYAPAAPATPPPPTTPGQQPSRPVVRVTPDVEAIPLPSYAPGNPTAPAPPAANGHLRIDITHTNPPHGTRVRTDTDGIDPQQVDVREPVTRGSMPMPSNPAHGGY